MLAPADLANLLDAEVGNVDNEPDAIAAWATAIADWFESATAGSAAIPAGVQAAKGALEAGLAGLSSTGSLAITNGVTSFWAALAAAPPAVFAAATLITPPPTIASMQALLDAAFAANVVAQLSKADALLATATAIYTSGFVGGTATFPPAVVTPIV